MKWHVIDYTEPVTAGHFCTIYHATVIFIDKVHSWSTTDLWSNGALLNDQSDGAAGCTTHIYYILHEINHFSLKAWHRANSLCVCCLNFSHKLFFAVIQVHSFSVGMVVKEWSLYISSAGCSGGRSSKCFDLIHVSWCSKYIIGYHGDQSEVNMAALVLILFCHLKEGGSIKVVIRVRGATFSLHSLQMFPVPHWGLSIPQWTTLNKWKSWWEGGDALSTGMMKPLLRPQLYYRKTPPLIL